MNLKKELFNFISGDSGLLFDDLAFEVFRYQSQNNKLYKRFLSILGRIANIPSSIDEIPLCPISVFKSNIVQTGNWREENIFMSSGTGGTNLRSQHFVKDVELYNSVSKLIFESFYSGNEIEIFALLPSYLENGNSSLVQMVSHLMNVYNRHQDNYFMYNHEELYQAITTSTSKHKILIGVTFALTDFVDQFTIEDDSLSVIFTGGMKNRKIELSYEEVYRKLKNAFALSSIDAEYGMTEMFSQSYAINSSKGLYSAGKTIKLLAKDLNDPLSSAPENKTGQLGFVDLANLDTLSFVLTDDLCLINEDDSFKLLGRRSDSDLRGCTLMYENY